jgi:hypothetical protein
MISFVMPEQCKTCIFRPGNLMHLEDGRLEEMCAITDTKDDNVICHQSEGLMGNIRCKAWCKGSVDRRPGFAVRFMQQHGLLQELPPEYMKELNDKP